MGEFLVKVIIQAAIEAVDAGRLPSWSVVWLGQTYPVLLPFPKIAFPWDGIVPMA